MSRVAALLTCAGVTLVAAVYLGSRGRAPLAPADFTAQGPDALEFCSDVRPKFIPVANKVSPVELTVLGDHTVRLRTAGGKPVGSSDLSRPPRLFAVNTAATTLHVFRLSPAATYGEWEGAGLEGAAKVFLDLIPSATGREMYVEAAVNGAGGTDLSPDATQRARAGLSVRADGPGSGWTMATIPSRVFVRDAVQLAVTGPGGARWAEEAVFDLSPGGATGFAIVKAGGTIAFDDPGRYAIWILGAQGEAVHRFTLFVSP